MSKWKSMEDAPLDREIEAINADGVIKMIRWYAMNRYRSCWCCDIAEDGLSYRAFIPVGWRK